MRTGTEVVSGTSVLDAFQGGKGWGKEVTKHADQDFDQEGISSGERGALAGVSALGLAGCGDGSGGGPLNILAGQSTSFPEEQEAWLKDMSKQLQNVAGPGLEWDFYADAETEQRKLQTAMTSGTGPDVFILGSTFVPTAVATNGFLELSGADLKKAG